MLKHPNREEAVNTVNNAIEKKLGKTKFELAVRSQLEVDNNTWQWWLKEGMQHNIADRIQGISCPTFVICAKNDPVISMDVIYEEVMPFLHRPRLIQMGRCGHLIPLESPRKLSKLLRKIAHNLLD